MTIEWQEEFQPGVALRQIVHQATEALVRMDADRLEELVRCAADLNREVRDAGDRAASDVEIREAASDVNLLGRILSKTRANLAVLFRLHALRLGRELDSQRRSAAGFTGYESTKIVAFPQIEKAAGYGDN